MELIIYLSRLLYILAILERIVMRSLLLIQYVVIVRKIKFCLNGV